MFTFIVNPVFIHAITASVAETKPFADGSYTSGNAIDGDFNTYAPLLN